MKIIDVVKSRGLWYLLFIGVCLTILGYTFGLVSSLKEMVFWLIGSVIVTFIYALIRMIQDIDEPIFFAKKWKE